MSVLAKWERIRLQNGYESVRFRYTLPTVSDIKDIMLDLDSFNGGSIPPSLTDIWESSNGRIRVFETCHIRPNRISRTIFLSRLRVRRLPVKQRIGVRVPGGEQGMGRW